MPTELYANNASTTVTSGGTTAPAAGTIETWTVASSAAFPAASSSANPMRQFAVIDPTISSEIMRVIDVTGTTWTVVRGVEGTTPTVHPAGFTVAAIVTQWGLNRPQMGTDLVALRNWYAALADVGNNPADILVFGDSIVEGSNAVDPETRWVNQMRDQVRAAYPVQGVGGGPNYLPAYYTGPTTDPAVIAGSPPTGIGGLGWRSYILSTSAHSAAFTVTGTSFRVWYTRSATTGVGSYQVTGTGYTGTLTTFSTTNASGSTDDGQTAVITFPSRGTYTVTVKWSSGGGVYLQGLAVYDGDETKGVRMWEGGWFGQTTSGWVSAFASNAGFATQRYGLIQPDLVIIALGTNDINNGITAATTKANLLTLIGLFRSANTVPPSILLVAYPQRDMTSLTTTEPWGNYIQAMYEIADANADVGVLDLTERMPAVLGDVTGLYSDSVHPSAKGQITIGAAVANFITEDRKPGAANYTRTKVMALTPSTNTTATAGDVWNDPTTTPQLLKYHDGVNGVALNGWEPLWTGTLAAAATSLASGTLPARDELMIVVRIPSLSVADIPALRFNGDTAANYWSRYITAATAAVTLTNAQTASALMARLTGMSVTNGRTYQVVMSNKLSATKLATVVGATGSGAVATIPAVDITGSFEWVNTTAQITSVTLLTAGGTATMAASSGFVVFGRNL